MYNFWINVKNVDKFLTDFKRMRFPIWLNFIYIGIYVQNLYEQLIYICVHYVYISSIYIIIIIKYLYVHLLWIPIQLTQLRWHP